MSDIITPPGILMCYGPTLFIAKHNKFKPSDEPRFEGNLIYNKAAQATAAFKELKAAIVACAKEKFGDKLNDKVFAARMKWPVKEYAAGEDGDVILKAWTKEQPQIVNPNGEYITVKGDVYSGQMARFSVRPFAFDNSGSVGVLLGLNSVQITKMKMPRLDGRKPADKVFSKVEDETAGAAEEAF